MAPVLLRVLLAAGLGALVSLDRRAAAQAMLAHPLVAASIIGLALGDLRTGLLVGVLIGLFWSGALPVGGVVPPDETLGAVVAAGCAVLGARAVGLEPLPAAVAGSALGVPAALVGRRLELLLRRYNGALAREAEKHVRDGDLSAVDRATRRALVAALGGAFVLTLVLLAIGVPLLRAGLPRIPSAGAALSRAAYPIPLAGLGAVVPGAGFRVGLAWATLGFAVGLLLIGGAKLA